MKQLPFSWSPVATDCHAIHYNILASNCGNCPTTTNHTTVTCTDVPNNDNVCNFAVQTVVCGIITSNFSDPISINTCIFYPTVTNTVYIASISSLAAVLIVSIVVFIMVIIIILTRNKAKFKVVLDLQATNTTKRSTQMESMYEEPLPSASAICTRDNIAYGHMKTTT